MIDTKAIRAAAEAAPKSRFRVCHNFGPFYSLIGDGDYFHGQVRGKERADFIATANPETVIALLDRLEAAEKALAEPAVEPVAWLHEWADGEKVPMLHGRDNRSHDQPISVIPLYASPPAEVPLISDEEIKTEAAKHQLSDTEHRHWYGDDYTVSITNIKGAVDFAHAIEQAVRQKAGL